MTADLRARGGAEALGGIGTSLAAIAEREDIDYITEAMVQHRLRLLDLQSEVRRDNAMAPFIAVRHAPRALDRRAAVAQNETLRLRTQLIAHGERTDRIDGRDKLLRAAFVLRLEIANLSHEAVALDKPTIKSDVPFPISRWYVETGDGQHWDGTLAATEQKSVRAIGYLGEPVKPGVQLDATIELASLTVDVTARARE